MTDLYRSGYRAALADLTELLNISIENGGGICWGDDFIERAHWDHEIRDQINELMEKADD